MWTAWGVIIGAVVLWLDHDPILAAIWSIGGIVIGTCAPKFFRPLAAPIFDWYHNVAFDLEREQRLIELVIAEETDSEEFKRLSNGETWAMCSACPPMAGLFHGILLGGIGGAFCPLDRTFNISASQGALFGIMLGAIGISFLAAIVFAIMLPSDKTQPMQVRLGRRAWMVASPLFVFPVAWHCFKWMLKKSRTQRS